MATPSAEFSQTLATHREPIYRYVLGIVREAEDLIQETLLRACEKLSSLEDRAKLFP